MICVSTPEDIYPAVEELIEILRSNPTSKLSVVLDHRMHKVAWTAREELIEELRDVLQAALASDVLDLEIVGQIERLLSVIGRELTS